VSDNHSGLDQTLADFDGLQLELASETKDWTRPLVVRTYDPDENGQEDYEDEAMLLEDHGYAHSSVLGWAGNPKEWVLTGTFSKDSDEGVSDDPDTEWHCYKCGSAVAESDRFCPHCGDQFAAETARDAELLAPAPADSPAIIVRTYKGKQQADAVAWFEADAADLAMDGYSPTTQSWAEGQWGCGAFLVALLLCIIFVGILVFIYMLLVKPVGTLTVTYTRNEAVAAPMPAPAAASPASGQGSVRERLAQLDELHGSGVVTDEEYAAKRAKILDEI
jgi:hypothetical protein